MYEGVFASLMDDVADVDVMAALGGDEPAEDLEAAEGGGDDDDDDDAPETGLGATAMVARKRQKLAKKAEQARNRRLLAKQAAQSLQGSLNDMVNSLTATSSGLNIAGDLPRVLTGAANQAHFATLLGRVVSASSRTRAVSPPSRAWSRRAATRSMMRALSLACTRCSTSSPSSGSQRPSPTSRRSTTRQSRA